MFTDHFADECARLLKPGGLLHSWTDVEEYFGVIADLMDHHPSFRKLPPPEEVAPAHDLDYRTSFERRKRSSAIFHGPRAGRLERLGEIASVDSAASAPAANVLEVASTEAGALMSN